MEINAMMDHRFLEMGVILVAELKEDGFAMEELVQALILALQCVVISEFSIMKNVTMVIS
jgi:hypothetical protein